MKLPFVLEDGLNHVAILRSTLETIDAYPEDEDLRADLMVMVEEAQRDLLSFLHDCRDSMGASPFDDPAYFSRLRETALRFITQGVPAGDLDRLLRTGDFAAAGDTLYHYPLHTLYRFEELRNIKGREFAVALLADLLLSAEEYDLDDRTGSFEPLYRKYLALMLIHYEAADPAWYGGWPDKGDEE